MADALSSGHWGTKRLHKSSNEERSASPVLCLRSATGWVDALPRIVSGWEFTELAEDPVQSEPFSGKFPVTGIKTGTFQRLPQKKSRLNFAKTAISAPSFGSHPLFDEK